MALDTQSKRLSAILPGMPFRAHLPIPDGTISQGDRQHLGLWCSAVLVAATVPTTIFGASVEFAATRQRAFDANRQREFATDRKRIIERERSQ